MVPLLALVALNHEQLRVVRLLAEAVDRVGVFILEGGCHKRSFRVIIVRKERYNEEGEKQHKRTVAKGLMEGGVSGHSVIIVRKGRYNKDGDSLETLIGKRAGRCENNKNMSNVRWTSMDTVTAVRVEASKHRQVTRSDE